MRRRHLAALLVLPPIAALACSSSSSSSDSGGSPDAAIAPADASPAPLDASEPTDANDGAVQADADAGPTNLLVNGDFSQGTTGWTAQDTSLSIDDGGIRLEQVADGPPGFAWQKVALVSGKSYTLTARFLGGTYAASDQVRAGFGINDGTYGALFPSQPPLTFTATQTDCWITMNNVSHLTGEYAEFDDLVLVQNP